MKVMIPHTLGFFLNMMIESIFVFSEHSSSVTSQARVVVRHPEQYPMPGS